MVLRKQSISVCLLSSYVKVLYSPYTRTNLIKFSIWTFLAASSGLKINFSFYRRLKIQVQLLQAKTQKYKFSTTVPTIFYQNLFKFKRPRISEKSIFHISSKMTYLLHTSDTCLKCGLLFCGSSQPANLWEAYSYHVHSLV